eukprot:m.37809 g.37809  ORF g.37809 m.37809 type:complete len:55 (-) comp6761_c0_seq2:138-302(-)
MVQKGNSQLQGLYVDCKEVEQLQRTHCVRFEALRGLKQNINTGEKNTQSEKRKG